MIAAHPWSWMPESRQRAIFIASTALALILMVALAICGSPLKTTASPAGIISFEFAGTLEAAQKIVLSWGQEQRILVGISLGLDYLYLFAYATSIGLLCVLVSRRYSIGSFVRSVGVLLCWGLVLAAALDALENLALILLLLGHTQRVLPPIASVAATVKFALIALCILYVVVAGLSGLRRAVHQHGHS